MESFVCGAKLLHIPRAATRLVKGLIRHFILCRCQVNRFYRAAGTLNFFTKTQDIHT